MSRPTEQVSRSLRKCTHERNIITSHTLNLDFFPSSIVSRSREFVSEPMYICNLFLLLLCDMLHLDMRDGAFHRLFEKVCRKNL
jgi:hypothetical protein